MSVSSPACSRTARRQVTAPLDSLWLSEEHLASAFQRFCLVSRTTRRYGSFVPGPLEARRRMGKRRMGNYTEYASTYEPPNAIQWRLVGRVDRTQWRWQAPTPRPALKEEKNSVLPSWLTGWKDKPAISEVDAEAKVKLGERLLDIANMEEQVAQGQEDAPNLVEPERQRDRHKDKLTVAESDVEADPSTHQRMPHVSETQQHSYEEEGLIVSIKQRQRRQWRRQRRLNNAFEADVAVEAKGEQSPMPLVLIKLLQKFQDEYPGLSRSQRNARRKLICRHLKFGIASGVLPEATINSILDTLWKLGEALLSNERQVERGLHLFAIWNACSANGARALSKLSPSSANAYVVQVAALSDVLPRNFLQNVLATLSTTHPQMVPGNWIKTSVSEADAPFSQACYDLTRLDVDLSASCAKQIEFLDFTNALREGGVFRFVNTRLLDRDIISAVRSSFKDLKAAVLVSEKSLDRIQTLYDDRIKTWNQAAGPLADVARQRLSWQLSSHHIEVGQALVNAQSSAAIFDSTASLHLWQETLLRKIAFLEPEKALDTLYIWCNTPGGEQDALSRVANSIGGGGAYCGSDIVADAIVSLHMEGHGTWSLLNAVLSKLLQDQIFDEILPLFSRLHSHGYKIPSVIVYQLANSLCHHRIDAAFSIYTLAHDMLPEGEILEGYQAAEFVFALVDDEDYSCWQIWENILRIPWYNPIPDPIRRQLPNERLDDKEHRFIEDLALKFAYAECRTHGLAFSNVNQALWHIRQRSRKPTSKISKAMCHAVITRDIESYSGQHVGGWVGNERLVYVLRLVRALDGHAAVNRIARLVCSWRTHLTRQLGARRGKGLNYTPLDIEALKRARRDAWCSK
ncbi:hypothetical protein BJ878DRAFT_496513 [Calycina marina]|uniref:Uncharacterized protein n=1 Tax=Calycina marina TaxID=1763456 RepID=A0A9P7Z6M5_9HELO|nr:hypothetical protein BJ878DRAFT_496513 [Calycina marina]